jgi:hypothetical protein
MLTYQPVKNLSIAAAVLVLGGWLLLSIRSRERLFAGVAFLIGILPVVFIRPRNLDSIYAVLPAVTLFAASLITSVFTRIPMPRQLHAVAAFTVTLALLSYIHHPYRIKRTWIREEADRIGRTLSDITALHLTPDARVLVLRDSFPPDAGYSILFAARIATRNLQLNISRIDTLPQPLAPDALRVYDVILSVRDGHLAVMPRPEFESQCLPRIHTCTPLLSPPIRAEALHKLFRWPMLSVALIIFSQSWWNPWLLM